MHFFEHFILRKFEKVRKECLNKKNSFRKDFKPLDCAVQYISMHSFFPKTILNTVSFQSIEIAKKVFLTFYNFFHFYLMRGFQKYERN